METSKGRLRQQNVQKNFELGLKHIFIYGIPVSILPYLVK